MKTVSTRKFTREFPKLHTEPLLVTDRGRVIGAWEPVPVRPKPVVYAKRVKEYCAYPLPFTGAALLKEGKKR